MNWNTTVVFGMGRERGNRVSGFHRSNNKGVFSGVVYRGDDRAPTDGWFSTGLFNQGFHLQEEGININGRMTSNIAQVNEQAGTTRGVISATTSVKMAAYWATHNNAEEGWVYCMYVADEEWAAEASMNLMGTPGKTPADVQQEIMFLSLPAERMYAARKVRRQGPPGGKQTFLVGPLVANPGYQGTNPYGLAFRDPDFSLFVDAIEPVLCQ